MGNVSPAANLRRYAATHLGKDSPLLAALVGDPDASVRARIAQRPSITAACKSTRLARDGDAPVRLAIASSSHVERRRKHETYEKGFFEKLFS